MVQVGKRGEGGGGEGAQGGSDLLDQWYTTTTKSNKIIINVYHPRIAIVGIMHTINDLDVV